MNFRIIFSLMFLFFSSTSYSQTHENIFPLRSRKIVKIYYPGQNNQSWHQKIVDIQVGSYLSSGSNRFAYTARNMKNNYKLVVKVNKSSFQRDFLYYAEDLKLQHLSESYAKKFNQYMKKELIHYVQAVIGETEYGEYCLLEPWLPGFKKYNNNGGYTNEDDAWGEIAQAFTHFTHMVSHGSEMICDIQGFEGQLTDPNIHSQCGNKTSGDFGQQGMGKFYQTHRCNQYCKKIHAAMMGYSQSYHPYYVY